MKIIRKSHSRKVLLLVLAVLLIVGSGYVAYASLSGNWWPLSASPNEKQITDGNGNPRTTTRPNNNTPDKTPVQYEGTPSNDSNELTGSINFSSVSNGILVIRTTIHQDLDSGTCELTLTHQTSKKTVKKSAQIVANPSSSTCKGFDIPVSELESGTWNVSVTVTSGTKSGEITGKAVV